MAYSVYHINYIAVEMHTSRRLSVSVQRRDFSLRRVKCARKCVEEVSTCSEYLWCYWQANLPLNWQLGHIVKFASFAFQEKIYVSMQDKSTQPVLDNVFDWTGRQPPPPSKPLPPIHPFLLYQRYKTYLVHSIEHGVTVWNYFTIFKVECVYRIWCWFSIFQVNF